jgi:copper chaperone NosL
VVLCAAVLLAACARLSIQALEIEPDDMCHHCKMAISERRFAAQLLSRDGEVSKFDDIGCMIQYLEGRKDKDGIAACFVVDFHSREWIDAQQAYFVRSSALKTPMSGNFAAFKFMSGAEEAAAAYGGKLLRFAGLEDELHSGPSPD